MRVVGPVDFGHPHVGPVRLVAFHGPYRPGHFAVGFDEVDLVRGICAFGEQGGEVVADAAVMHERRVDVLEYQDGPSASRLALVQFGALLGEGLSQAVSEGMLGVLRGAVPDAQSTRFASRGSPVGPAKQLDGVFEAVRDCTDVVVDPERGGYVPTPRVQSLRGGADPLDKTVQRPVAFALGSETSVGRCSS